MGNEASLPLEMCATFDADEIKRLGKRYIYQALRFLKYRLQTVPLLMNDK